MNINNSTFILIGIGNQNEPQWESNVKELVNNHTIFSGGKRHYNIVKPFLPAGHLWILIEGKMDDVISSYKEMNQPIVVFTSGDPFFYGFGNTIKRLCPNARVDSYPYFSSIQRLCHKTQTNYGSVKTITLHGRPWNALDEALINNEALIGVLTDDKHTPQIIAQRLLSYGYDQYEMIVGEELDGDTEKISVLNLDQAIKYSSLKLNCLLLKECAIKRTKKFIPDASFQTLPGRPGMITKLPIRMISIQALTLEKVNEFWDVGSCTGAIAIEAKLNYSHLNCTAFEKRTECEQIIDSNAKKHRAPGIGIQIGDFFEQDLSVLNRPQSIFIGGHGNRLEELITLIDQYIEIDGVVVMNAVLEKSYVVFYREFEKLNYKISPPMQIGIDQYNTVRVLVATKK